MQFLSIKDNTKLRDLSDLVGPRNLSTILHVNGLERAPNIGEEFKKLTDSIAETAINISVDRKIAILNTLTDDSDVFEYVSLMDEAGWKVLSAINSLPSKLRVPDDITLPDSADVLGNGVEIASRVYNDVTKSLKDTGEVDPSAFTEYSTIGDVRSIIGTPFNEVATAGMGEDPMQWFRAPWGDITLYSSIDDSTIDFPVYPEELADGVKANYTQMPELLYQYEPWNIYSSSGPRTQQFNFHFHRDMWTGDHRDGKANELIRACEANCYADYKGSAVNVPTVTLYLKGKSVISGIMTDVNVNWSGPIGWDGWWLDCNLSISITEVSKTPLNYSVVKNKPLIG